MVRMFGTTTAIAVGLAAGIVGAAKGADGPFSTSSKTYDLETLDSTDRKVDVYYPSDGAKGTTFPLISYAHGDHGGGDVNRLGYWSQLHALASYGFVVAATRSCSAGCKDDPVSLPGDARGFGTYYLEQIKVIKWVEAQNASFDGVIGALVDRHVGYGIAGHSMGGQATLFSSSYANATQNRIKAAVMHHAYSSSHPKPTIPFLAMTGSKDTVAKPKLTKAFYDEADGTLHRGYVNKKGANHLEPLFKNNM